MRVEGDVAFFGAAIDGPAWAHEAIVHLGWEDRGRSYERRVAAVPDIEAVHDRLARALPTMIEQRAGRAPVPWGPALETWLERTSGARIHWWLYGSAALAARGLPIEPGDLDLAVDDPRAAAELLDDLMVEPVTFHPHWVAAWTARAFDGACIEWLAEPRPPADGACHEQGPLSGEHLEMIRWRGYDLLVPALDLQLRTAEQRGLVARAALIRQANT